MTKRVFASESTRQIHMHHGDCPRVGDPHDIVVVHASDDEGERLKQYATTVRGVACHYQVVLSYPGRVPFTVRNATTQENNVGGLRRQDTKKKQRQELQLLANANRAHVWRETPKNLGWVLRRMPRSSVRTWCLSFHLWNERCESIEKWWSLISSFVSTSAEPPVYTAAYSQYQSSLFFGAQDWMMSASFHLRRIGNVGGSVYPRDTEKS